MTFDSGICTLFREISHVDDARMPSFSSRGPISTPGVLSGTKNAVIPLCPLFLSVYAKNTPTSASHAEVTLKLPFHLIKSLNYSYFNQ